MLNYPIKLFDRERYIDRKEKRIAARTPEYYNKENSRFLLDKPIIQMLKGKSKWNEYLNIALIY